jgi:dihydroorotate dehydrogenase
MIYQLAQKVLFAIDPERAHELALQGLRLAHRLGATPWLCNHRQLPVRCMGVEFPNPLGLAAGLDKNADYFEALGDLGFGFIEVGTVTPRPQPGNPRPRIFRIPQAQAVINRLGFNNKGVDHLVRRVRSHRFKGVLGINIGKNFDTPLEQAAQDYIHCLEKIYPYADYVTINISSPNTMHLRELQTARSLDHLLGHIGQCRQRLADHHRRRVPIAVKVAPDLTMEAIKDIARMVIKHRMDAIIATNTTVSRNGVEGLPHAAEQGGLSGRPLKPLADETLRSFRRQLAGEVALIGVGGISSGQDATDKLDMGADLVQLYTGLIYRGPELVGECLAAITRRVPS